MRAYCSLEEQFGEGQEDEDGGGDQRGRGTVHLVTDEASVVRLLGVPPVQSFSSAGTVSESQSSQGRQLWVTGVKLRLWVTGVKLGSK